MDLFDFIFGKPVPKKPYIFYRLVKSAEFTVSDAQGKSVRISRLLNLPPEAEAEMVSVLEELLGKGPYRYGSVEVKEVPWGELTEW